MSQLALDLIAKEKIEKTGILDLGNCGLTEIPDEVFELEWLEILILSSSYSIFGLTFYSKNTLKVNRIAQINENIRKLRNLTILSLNNNDVNDIKPIASCRLIEFLSLENNENLKDISPIQNLENLETLILKGTSIEDKSHLNNLKLLKHLDISELENQTDKTRIPSRLENLKDLEVLKVTLVDCFDFSIFKKLKTLHITYWHCYNYLEDLSFIGEIVNLEDLLINYIDEGFDDENYSKHAKKYRYKGKIEDLSFIKNLTQLKRLTLTNHLIKNTEILKNFPQLEKLNLSKNRIENRNGLKELIHLEELKLNSCGLYSVDFISKSKSLQWLELNNNYINNLSPIEGLFNLEILHTNGNNISDIQFLKECLLLRSLEIEKNNITNILVIKHFKELRLLKAGNNNIINIEGLENLSKIQNLYLEHNQIVDISALTNLTEITILDLSHNNIESIDSLLTLCELWDLKLNNNSIDNINGIKNLVKLSKLNLSHNNIKNIDSLLKLTNLWKLNLNHNKINDIKGIKNLTKLIIPLDLSHNEIVDISPLCKLQYKQIRLSNNNIQDISPLGEYISDITHCDLSYNKIQDISPLSDYNGEILSCDLSFNKIQDVSCINDLNIGRINLSNNKISEIPIINNSKKLYDLDLSNNEIRLLPNIENIEKLNLSYNSIKDIPRLEYYGKLSYLNLEGNNIVDIKNLLPFFQHGKITYWSNEKYLYGDGYEDGYSINNIILVGNPIQNPPIEMIKQGTEAIINYFDQLKVQGEDYLFEAKMIILGESGAGKTTFFRKIKDNKATLPKDKETTLGINSKPWYFEISSEDIDKAIDKPLKNKKAVKVIKERGFRINRWDFGGQEIYHSTHQFFLSHRSFYVLLADTREQKTDFNYWLNIAEQRSGESPLVVILNEKHGHTWAINEYGFKQRFPFYKETYNLNLAEKTDFTKLKLLRDKVKDYVLSLPHIGDTLPANWVQIRLHLSSLNEKYIPLYKFREICKEHHISKIDDILTMSQYFHDIGVFIHFQDNVVLKNRIFLDANWTTKTIYDLLNDHQIKDNLGRFSKNYVHSIWNDEDCLLIIDELLELLNEFGLAYPVNKNNFIIPQRLSQVTPYERWKYENKSQLLLSYTFDKFMPKGLMSRLIVALHQYIYDQNLVWSRGMNIKREEAYAEVIEQYGGQNRFDIRIAGKDRRDLLITITNAFGKILEDYPKLKYNQKIPCNCDECKIQTDFNKKSFYDYDKLNKRLKKGKRTIECEQTFDDVQIEPMLYDVFGKSTNHNKEIERLTNINQNTYKETIKAWLPNNYHNLPPNVLETLIEAEAKYSNSLNIGSNNFNTSIQQYGVAIENQLKDIFVNYHTYIWEDLSEIEINRITPRRGTEHGKFSKCVKDDVIKYQFKEMIEILKKVNAASSDLFKNFKKFLSNKYDITILLDNTFLEEIDGIRGSYRNEVAHKPTPINQSETDEFRIIARDIIKKLVNAKK